MERVIFFTFATKPERGFAQYLGSCLRNGIVPRVLGMGREWEGFTQKIQLVREQLDFLNDRDLVVVTDSYDLVFQTGADRVACDFVSYGKPIVFSAESYPGWPYANEILPETPNPLYRSLNAGFWVARAGDARKIIDEAYGDKLRDGSVVDQGVFQQWFAVNRGRAIVDYRNVLATTTYHSDNNLGYTNRGTIFNKYTGSMPCAIHGTNGWDMGQVWDVLKLPGQDGLASEDPCCRRCRTYRLAAQHPWSLVKPGVEATNGTFFSEGSQKTLRELLRDKVSVILELGSGDGLGSARFFLDHSDALLICNDLWAGKFSAFCSNLWNDRDRVIPLRMSAQAGLRTVREYGIMPDLVYVNANQSYGNVMAYMSLAYELFPGSIVVGNGFRLSSVRQAVLDFTRSRRIDPGIGNDVWVLRRWAR